MSYKFNPFTGTFDYYETGGAGGQNLAFQKIETIADTDLVTNKTFNLVGTPVNNSDTLYLNGIAQETTCYNITGTTLTLIPSFPLEEGDNILINYVTTN